MAATAVGVLHLERLPFTVCYFKALTGLPCLSCGTTRMLARLVRLDLAGAVVTNPLAAFGALALVPWALADLVLLPGGRALSVDIAPGVARAARLGAVLAVLVNWAYLIAAGR
jgi:hypothetical protein